MKFKSLSFYLSFFCFPVSILAFINILNIAQKEAGPLYKINIAINDRNAFAGNYNQKPYYYHPDT